MKNLRTFFVLLFSISTIVWMFQNRDLKSAIYTDTANRSIFTGEKEPAPKSFRSNIEIHSGKKRVSSVLGNPETEFGYASMQKDGARSDTNDPNKNQQYLTAKHVWKQKAEQCQYRLPQCIIIGVAKCGTRALIEFLDIHPNIVAAFTYINGQKNYEPCYFDRNYNKGLNWYVNTWMPCTSLGEVTIEKSPCYFYSKEAATRMKELDPQIKLILTVKDPVLKAMSSYVQQRALNYIKTPSFEEAVIDASGKIKEDTLFINKSLYWKYLEPWLTNFRREQLLVIDGHLLVTKPHKELQKVEKFLGIPTYIKEDNFVFDRKKRFYCVKLRLGEQHTCLPPSKGRPHPEIEPDVLVQLRKFFKPHNEMFFRMIGQQFDWGY